MISNRGFDPNSELVQAHILGTGLGPNDSQIDDDAMGPVNVQLPTPELRTDRSDGRRCRGFRLTDLQ